MPVPENMRLIRDLIARIISIRPSAAVNLCKKGLRAMASRPRFVVKGEAANWPARHFPASDIAPHGQDADRTPTSWKPTVKCKRARSSSRLPNVPGDSCAALSRYGHAGSPPAPRHGAAEPQPLLAQHYISSWAHPIGVNMSIISKCTPKHSARRFSRQVDSWHIRSNVG